VKSSKEFLFGPNLEKGAKIDHMKIHTQKNYIWKALSRLLMVENIKLFKNYTLRHTDICNQTSRRSHNAA
jgi:integrase